jgi:hypothetical protein
MYNDELNEFQIIDGIHDENIKENTSLATFSP